MRIHKKLKRLFHGFTLVELIVVISVLGVLATIAMTQVSNITAWARDSQRMTDMSSMKSSIELYKAKTGKLPTPTNGSWVTYSGGLLWTQGTFGESVTREIKSITPKPIDPINKIEYVYSVANNNREFELGGILEKATGLNYKTRGSVIQREHPLVRPSDVSPRPLWFGVVGSLGGRVAWLANEPLSDQDGYLGSQVNHLPWDSTNPNSTKLTNQGISPSQLPAPSKWQVSLSFLEMTDLGFDQTFAASQNVTFIEWTYNGISLKVETGSKTYVVAAPSLIGWYLGDSKMENTGLTIEGLGSLPAGFSGATASTANTGTFTPAVAWSGSELPETSTGAEVLIQWLQNVYSGSVATSLSQISSLVNATGSQVTALWQGLIQNALGGTVAASTTQNIETPLTPFFIGSGTTASPWKKYDSSSLTGCQNYNLESTHTNTGALRGTGTCASGKQCLTSGVYSIDPDGTGATTPINAYCDMTTNGGGWTLIITNAAGNYRYGSAFYNGTLGSNSNFAFSGVTLNSWDLEKLIRLLPSSEIMIGTHVYSSAVANTTFAQKKAATSPWTATVGNLCTNGNTISWNQAFGWTYTNTYGVLSCMYAVAYGDSQLAGIGVLSISNSWEAPCLVWSSFDLMCNADITVGYAVHRSSGRDASMHVWVR